MKSSMISSTWWDNIKVIWSVKSYWTSRVKNLDRVFIKCWISTGIPMFTNIQSNKPSFKGFHIAAPSLYQITYFGMFLNCYGHAFYHLDRSSRSTLSWALETIISSSWDCVVTTLGAGSGCLFLGGETASQWCLQQASTSDCVLVPSLIEPEKAIKNSIEIKDVIFF